MQENDIAKENADDDTIILSKEAALNNDKSDKTSMIMHIIIIRIIIINNFIRISNVIKDNKKTIFLKHKSFIISNISIIKSGKCAIINKISFVERAEGRGSAACLLAL